MRIREIIKEALSDYGPDWVHFTKHPMLTINPRQIHSDPAGIYFFPASIVPQAEMWPSMPYKFTVNIKPDARILDVSTITPEQIYQMINAAGPEARERFDQYIQQYPPKDNIKMFDMAWERLQGHYSYEGGKNRQYASYNGMLRRLGWQAIFDDTGSIHSGEPEQLLVLDPRIITNVRMQQKTGSGYTAMQKVIRDVTELGNQYGQVSVGQIQKPNKDTYYAERDNLLMCQMEIRNPQNEENYASVILRIRPQFPDRISASIQYSRPRLSHGSGAEYSISKGQYPSGYGGLSTLARDLATIFTPQENPQQVMT